MKLKNIFAFLLTIITAFGCVQSAQKLLNMQISVKTLTGRTILLEVSPDETIQKIKSRLQEKVDINPEEQILTLAGKELEDLKTLNDYRIKRFSCIKIESRLKRSSILNYQKVASKVTDKRSSRDLLKINSFHVSCKSDEWNPYSDYVGIILYQYDGKTDWYANKLHCRSGYILIKQAPKINCKDQLADTWIYENVYQSFFAKKFNPDKVQASAFSYDGEQATWKYQAWTYSSPDSVHDANQKSKKKMSESERIAIKETIDRWTKTKEQNNDVRKYDLYVYREKAYSNPNSLCPIQ